MPIDRTLALLMIGVPLSLIALSIPLVMGRVPPNHWYGFRTRRTFSSDAVWYRANREGGWLMLAAGAVQLMAGGAWLIVRGQISPVFLQVLLGGPPLAAVLIWAIRSRS